MNSPCTKRCHVNPDFGYCTGCFRTPTEIAEWHKADDRKALHILTNSKIRKRKWENKCRYMTI
tara:strand:- start:143 stop:331 length:189 start_codon:yes stop_codon:yes gene_type:complete